MCISNQLLMKMSLISFRGTFIVSRKEMFLPDTKPEFGEPQFAFTRQNLITENSKYFPVTCQKCILKEMSVALRD